MAALSTTGPWGHAAALRDKACSLVARRGPRESRPDALHQLIAHRAIAIEALLAAAFDRGRIGGRPVLHVDRQGAGELERAVVRLRRERNDQVEIESLEVLELLERHRPMGADVDADLAHGGDRE